MQKTSRRRWRDDVSLATDGVGRQARVHGPVARRGHCLYSSGMSDTAETPPSVLRAVLAQMPDYKPGKPAAAPGGVTAYKLSSNENPYGPLPSVRRRDRRRRGDVNRYPDMAVRR